MVSQQNTDPDVSALKAIDYFHVFVRIMAVVMSLAACIGAVLHVAVGGLLGVNMTTWELVGMGLKNGAWYAGVWAPGLGIVGCFIAGHRNSRKRVTGNA